MGTARTLRWQGSSAFSRSWRVPPVVRAPCALPLARFGAARASVSLVALTAQSTAHLGRPASAACTLRAAALAPLQLSRACRHASSAVAACARLTRCLRQSKGLCDGVVPSCSRPAQLRTAHACACFWARVQCSLCAGEAAARVLCDSSPRAGMAASCVPPAALARPSAECRRGSS